MMEPLPKLPAPGHRLAALARWSLVLTAGVWLSIGCVWGLLHFFIVPRIGEFRPWLEREASTALGITVRVGAIEARSNGLIPSVELRDVRLLDAQDRVALHLPRVVAALSPRSLFARGFEQLYIEAPQLEVRRTLDGHFQIAGLTLPEASHDDGNAADWLFSQTEVVVRHGEVRWVDEMRSAPPLVLTDVDVVLRNRHRNHALRIDATPPALWGQRVQMVGMLRSPILSRRPGQWRDWGGQLFADFGTLDTGLLSQYTDLGVQIDQGRGAMRIWADVERGAVMQATADVALDDVSVRAANRLPALDLDSVTGRLGVTRLRDGFSYFTEALAFATKDGLKWPGGNVRLSLWDAQGGNPARGELQADRLDLAALSEIAQRLPIEEAVRDHISRLKATGQVDLLRANWVGPLEQPVGYAAKGRVSQLALAPLIEETLHTPGVRGLGLDFDVTQAGGKAVVALQKGAFLLPGVLEDDALELEQLSANLEWKRIGSAIQLSGSGIRFANPDVQGDAQFSWRSGADGAPGAIDLQAHMARAELRAVHRYFPLSLPETRTYLHAALLGGTASNVQVKLKGDLARFPFKEARQGEFRVSADVKGATYAYAPTHVQPAASLPWPALTQVWGELLIDNERLQVRNARGLVADGLALQFSRTEAQVTRLYDDAAVSVAAQGSGPLADVVGLVNTSPVAAMTGRALSQASAGGNADYRLKLNIPLKAPQRSTVTGSITLANNDLQITSSTPRMARTRGVIGFTENGFTVTGGQARALGGDVRIEGGIQFGAAAGSTRTPPAVLRIQGTASAEGLRQAGELGVVARLAQFVSGTTPYAVALGWRAGLPDLLITSPLTGLALNLPAPLAKAAEVPLPLRLELGALRNGSTPPPHGLDQLQLELGRLGSAVFVRDVNSEQTRVLRGAIAVGLSGDETAPMPAEGVLANINLAQLDIDAWSRVIGTASTTGLGSGYVPNSLAARAGEITAGGRKIRNVVLGGGRDGLLWRANVDSAELSGYVEYRQPTGPAGGRLYARLARMIVGQSTAQDVEDLLDEQPSGIPALDVVVEDFELRGRKLGRLEVEAVNSGVSASNRDVAREWKLNRFNVVLPEAVLTASGNWTATGGTTAAQLSRDMRERRRTSLNFKLDIQDAGQLLERFGMKEVVRRGKGRLEGQLAWQGSPITPDFASMAGGFNINVETGQFLKADPGIAKLLGVLSLQSLPRRLTLDFRDVFSEGFAFDFVRGDATIDQGVARTNNLQMKGVNAAVLMEGQADIAHETQLLKVVVVPEINAGSASLIASAINPLVGLSTFLAQLILRRPLIDANTLEFQIDGTWADPRVTKIERKVPAPASGASNTNSPP